MVAMIIVILWKMISMFEVVVVLVMVMMMMMMIRCGPTTINPDRRAVPVVACAYRARLYF